VQHSIAIGPAYIKAKMVDRRTPEETKQFTDAQLAALRESGLRKLLISVRSSRAIFKVEEWNLTRVLDEMAGMEGLKVALVSDSPDLEMAHQYVTLIANLRGLAFKAFRDEQAGVEWLMTPGN
jgi:hypothetical protein